MAKELFNRPLEESLEKKARINLATAVGYTALAMAEMGVLGFVPRVPASIDEVYVLSATLILGLISATRAKFFENKIEELHRQKLDRDLEGFVSRMMSRSE